MNDDLNRHPGYLLAEKWRVLPAENRLIGPGLDQRIADKYMRVLVHLCENPGVVSRQDLLEAVWPDTVVVEEVLTRSVSELRKLFDDDPRAPRVIETIPKRGYRLLVPVEVLPAGQAPSPPGRTADPQRLLGIGPLLGLVAAVVAGVLFWRILLVSAEKHRDVPLPAPALQQLTSLKGVEEYPAISPDGRRLAFAWEGDDHTPTGVFVKHLGQDDLLALTPPHGHYAYPAWSADGRLVAYSRVAGEQPGLYQVPADGGPEELLVPPHLGRPAITPDFAPDGGALVYAAPAGGPRTWRLERLELASGLAAPLTADLPDGTSDRRPRHSPDGSRLAFVHTTGSEQMLGLMPATGGPARFLGLGERGIRDFDWMPDGNQLLVSADDGLWRVDVEDGSRHLVSADRGLSCVSMARDGSLAAFTQASGQWGIWDLDPASGELAPLVDSSRYDGRPALATGEPAPDRPLVFITNRRGHYELWAAGRDGGRARARFGDPGANPDHPCWSPDGTLLACDMLHQGRSVVALIPVAGGAPRILTDREHHEAEPTFSRDGQWLYFRRSRQGQTRIWKRPVAGGAAVPVTDFEAWRAQESLDGSQLFVQETGWECRRLLALTPGQVTAQVVLDLEGELLADWAPAPGGLYVCRHAHHDDRRYLLALHPLTGQAPRQLAVIESRRAPELVPDPATGRFIVALTTLLECDLLGLTGITSP